MAGRHGVYMDYQATTPMDPRVLDAMMPLLIGADGFGNPHSVDHGYGWDAADAVEGARAQVADLIRAAEDEIVFTSGATEANNLAVLGAARAASDLRKRVVVSAIEHKCVLSAARSLADHGYDVSVAPVVSDGRVDLDALSAMITPAVAVVSVMAMNNETGVDQPTAEIGALCRSAGALFHVDAAQALPVAEVDVDVWQADLVSLSAHKAYGPKGIGALYVRRSARPRVRPVMFGGGQEDGLRPGTLPAALCVGFGEACAVLTRDRAGDAARMEGLRDRFLALLRADLDPIVNGRMSGRHPGNLNIRFAGVDADLLLAAARPRLAASTGSACTSGLPEPSHVLTAMGLSSAEAGESIRLSVGRFTTEQDVEDAAEAMVRAVGEVRLSLAA